jgi:hypothetical protein
VLVLPAARTDAPAAERFVNVSYPLLDLAALAPILVMIRIALAFRPGRVWVVWAALLVGFATIAVGDTIAVALWTNDAMSENPLTSLTWLLGDFFVAWGAKLQYELLTD